MRKLVASILIVATASVGAPVSLLAQTTAARPGTISGEAVDAGGRALVNQRVELVQGNQIVQTTTTGSRGTWTFSNVAPGDYVVRMIINGQVAGIRVSLEPGASLTNALIVAPSAAVPSAAFLAALGPLGGLALGGAIVAAIVTTAILTTGS